MTDHNELKRTLTLGPVVLYGVGTILGAGIYVLIGEVACVAGIWAPLSFGIAAVLAARVLHGASRNNWLPPIFSRINLRTQTPVVATVLVAVAVLVFAL